MSKLSRCGAPASPSVRSSRSLARSATGLCTTRCGENRHPSGPARPNAKDDLRAKARELRLQGLDYEEIVAQLGVSKSSVSLWVRDLPRPRRVTPEECAKRTSERMRRYWTAERPVRAARRAAASAAAAASIGDLTGREILIAGAVAYWCEGAKNKPHRRADRVTFANSDPELISFFLLFLDTAGIPRSDLAFQLQIHETADVAAAERFWLILTEARAEQFRKTSLKQPQPGPRGRTPETTITDACGWTSSGAASCIGRLRAGPPR